MCLPRACLLFCLLHALSLSQVWCFSTQGPKICGLHGEGGRQWHAKRAMDQVRVVRARAQHKRTGQLRCSSRGSAPRGFGMPLKLTDRDSGRAVYLVSTMHYNPASILRVVQAVDELAQEKRLSAVVIESCPTRYGAWKKTRAVWRRAILTSEMQIAAERAKVAGVEFILGDQPIEELHRRCAEIFRQTLKDLASPLTGGWSTCSKDIFKAGKSVLSSITNSSPTSRLDPAMVIAAPVSIVRYSLAWLVGSPISVAGVCLSRSCSLFLARSLTLTSRSVPLLGRERVLLLVLDLSHSHSRAISPKAVATRVIHEMFRELGDRGFGVGFRVKG